MAICKFDKSVTYGRKNLPIAILICVIGVDGGGASISGEVVVVVVVVVVVLVGNCGDGGWW
jgi:hypothetical protein